MSDLIMTGGLLRYTGKDIRNEANAAAGSASGGGDDATGPAARLAVKMVSRDPGRSFAAGERVPFVFLSGPGSQQDRAEDPSVVLHKDLPVDYSLYWTNKICQPLKRLLEPALSQAQVKDLFTGGPSKARVVLLSIPLVPGDGFVALVPGLGIIFMCGILLVYFDWARLEQGRTRKSRR